MVLPQALPVMMTVVWMVVEVEVMVGGRKPNYNLINNFSIIACGARHARSCATAYLLTGAQDTLRAGIVRVDRELFHQIILSYL